MKLKFTTYSSFKHTDFSSIDCTGNNREKKIKLICFGMKKKIKKNYKYLLSLF